MPGRGLQSTAAVFYILVGGVAHSPVGCCLLKTADHVDSHGLALAVETRLEFGGEDTQGVVEARLDKIVHSAPSVYGSALSQPYFPLGENALQGLFRQLRQGDAAAGMAPSRYLGGRSRPFVFPGTDPAPVKDGQGAVLVLQFPARIDERGRVPEWPIIQMNFSTPCLIRLSAISL